MNRFFAAVLLSCALASPGAARAAPPEAARAEMARVPAGEFTMGARGGEPDAAPAHRVSLGAYRIDKTEVTVAAYGACVRAGACKPPKASAESPHCNWGSDRADANPINCVSWEEARTFCAWRGARLPTEAEWERAARGGAESLYPWGAEDPTCKRAVMQEPGGPGGCGADATSPVCSRPAGAGPYGLCDMGGDVWEWTSDWYGANYYAESPASNPKGPAEGAMRVLRGGGWQSQDARYLRTTHRFESIPAHAGSDTGFRCAGDD